MTVDEIVWQLLPHGWYALNSHPPTPDCYRSAILSRIADLAGIELAA